MMEGYGLMGFGFHSSCTLEIHPKERQNGKEVVDLPEVVKATSKTFQLVVLPERNVQFITPRLP